MALSSLQKSLQAVMGEPAKNGAEFILSRLSRGLYGQAVIRTMKGGPRVKNRRLQTAVAGLQFENPLMVGPGYDKQGRLADAIYLLNFSGIEVGGVTLYGQPGNPKPRMFLNTRDGVALNRFGFNSVGAEKLALNLARQQKPGIIGLNISKNKLVPDEYAPWSFTATIEQLYEQIDYFVICVSSPNTPGLRRLLGPKHLPQIVRESKKTLDRLGPKPLFVKTVIDMSLQDLDKAIEVCVTEGASGIIDTNTSISKRLKRRYGWENEAGGFSGRDPSYRNLANERMKHITRVSRGTGLARIGVGGIYDSAAAIERLQAGAQVLQLVTALLPLKPRLGRQINQGILNYIDQTGARDIKDIIGVSV